MTRWAAWRLLDARTGEHVFERDQAARGLVEAV
ncbi:MAG: hypothetical protein ACI9S9_004672, partial [Planctomycetota bacterium]